MKIFLNILLINIFIAVIGFSHSHAQVLYVKKDTTITFNVNNLDTVKATLSWTISPALNGFVPSSDSVQKVTFTGNSGDLYTLKALPVGPTGCAGNFKTMDIQIYEDKLPVTVTWKEDPAPLCPDKGNTVEGTIVVNGYSGPYSIVYQMDEDTIKTVDFNTNSNATIRISKGLNNTSVSKYAYYKVKILRFSSNNVIIAYSADNAPTMTIAVKPVPFMEEIEYK